MCLDRCERLYRNCEEVIVVTVNTVRSGRVRRFEVPSDTAANLALRRPDSRIVLPMAKMTEARSKAYADELTLKAGRISMSRRPHQGCVATSKWT